MGISFYKIGKWYRMLSGKSILHVNQNMGKEFRPGELRGYFNNLTEKVLRDNEAWNTDGVPLTVDETGRNIVFPIAIFQYGLGAYDLFLSTGEAAYLNKFFVCADWAVSNQMETGAWNNFYFVYPEYPYSAMCQGEGCSLLLRAYMQTNDNKYLFAAKKAIDFMLISNEDGGVTQYSADEIVLLEYTHLPAVLNGWIFALFGLYDICLVSDEEKYRNAYTATLGSLKRALPEYDLGYWSKYDEKSQIASPFYHDLHIAQLQALYLVSADPVFDEYRIKFEKYRESEIKKARAFIKKAFQKIME